MEEIWKDIPGYEGIYKVSSWIKRHRKWMASIQIKGVNKNLGLYDNEIEAHKAYQNKLKELSNWT